ncbi:MAG: hypothetical protein ABSH28_15645, partial [Acidobacteriota bacterium]
MARISGNRERTPFLITTRRALGQSSPINYGIVTKNGERPYFKKKGGLISLRFFHSFQATIS